MMNMLSTAIERFLGFVLVLLGLLGVVWVFDPGNPAVVIVNTMLQVIPDLFIRFLPSIMELMGKLIVLFFVALALLVGVILFVPNSIWREFQTSRAALPLLILQALTNGPRDALDILRTIRPGNHHIGAARFFRILGELLTLGVIEELPAPPERDDIHKHYRLTPAGEKFLAEKMATNE